MTNQGVSRRRRVRRRSHWPSNASHESQFRLSGVSRESNFQQRTYYISRDLLLFSAPFQRVVKKKGLYLAYYAILRTITRLIRTIRGLIHTLYLSINFFNQYYAGITAYYGVNTPCIPSKRTYKRFICKFYCFLRLRFCWE